MNHDQNTERDGSFDWDLARRWAVAAANGEPTDYDIPALPDWASGRDAEGRLALAESVADEPFIVADEPVDVER